ncbi:MAG: hypothetical protein HKO59_12570 [Phycisphaerales bacterium]|nr:cytochrome c oxidase subunit 3 [Phycisphaerae bacterium]NNM26796.1 hypothetical protein [Phycisphaerales bacterium]
MCIKYVEYKHKFEHNIVWGTTFYEEPHHAAAAGADHGDGHAVVDPDDGDVAAVPVTAVTPPPVPQDEVIDGLVVTRSAIPPAAVGPEGLSLERLVTTEEHGAPELPVEDAGEPDPRHDPDRPANAHIFFGIYFCMTGLHGVHVLVGMGVIAWLFILTAKGRFSKDYFTPIDLGGLYWHVVDLIWIFLFPLLYLIG